MYFAFSPELASKFIDFTASSGSCTIDSTAHLRNIRFIQGHWDDMAVFYRIWGQKSSSIWWLQLFYAKMRQTIDLDYCGHRNLSMQMTDNIRLESLVLWHGCLNLACILKANRTFHSFPPNHAQEAMYDAMKLWGSHYTMCGPDSAITWPQDDSLWPQNINPWSQ